MSAISGSVGAVLGAYGASKERKQQNAQFQNQMSYQRNQSDTIRNLATNPLNLNIDGMGGVSNGNATMDPRMMAYSQLFGNTGQNLLGGNSATSGFQNFANGVGADAVPQLFGQYLDSSSQLPTDAFNNVQNAMYPSSLGMMQQGQGLFGQLDQSALSSNYLNTLRQQAQPYNQQQMDMVSQSAFNRGQLGGPGGRLALQQMLNQQNQQDLGFQNSAINLGQQQQQQNYNIGSGLFGAGAQGLQNYMSNAGNISNLINSRGQQRMSDAMNLFGFGANLNQQDLSTGGNFLSQAQSGQQQGFSNLYNLLNLSNSAATARAAAVAGGQQPMPTAPQGDPMAAMIGSLGTGLFTSAVQNGAFSRKAPQQATANQGYWGAGPWTGAGSNPYDY